MKGFFSSLLLFLPLERGGRCSGRQRTPLRGTRLPYGRRTVTAMPCLRCCPVPRRGWARPNRVGTERASHCPGGTANFPFPTAAGALPAPPLWKTRSAGAAGRGLGVSCPNLPNPGGTAGGRSAPRVQRAARAGAALLNRRLRRVRTAGPGSAVPSAGPGGEAPRKGTERPSPAQPSPPRSPQPRSSVFVLKGAAELFLKGQRGAERPQTQRPAAFRDARGEGEGKKEEEWGDDGCLSPFPEPRARVNPKVRAAPRGFALPLPAGSTGLGPAARIPPGTGRAGAEGNASPPANAPAGCLQPRPALSSPCSREPLRLTVLIKLPSPLVGNRELSPSYVYQGEQYLPRTAPKSHPQSRRATLRQKCTAVTELSGT